MSVGNPEHPHGHWYGPPGPDVPPQEAPRPRPGWSARRTLVALGAVAALAAGAGGAGAMAAIAFTGGTPAGSVPAAVTGAVATGTVARIAAGVQPSVVSIETRSRTGEGTGSGVILRADGVIVTNAHVVDGAEAVTVKFSTGRTAQARVLGADAGKDVAVIKAEGVSGLKPVTVGDSGRLSVGDPVLAVGSPLGLDGSVTSGIVSALGRDIQESDSRDTDPSGRTTRRQGAVIEDAIQTDAAINPGNSGGALVDGAGRLIGINTAIATSGSGEGSIGLGFAIPSGTAVKVAERIITDASL